MTASLPFHPASHLFPLMDGIELGRLIDDIKSHGLLDPIVLVDGMVLDGRNRLRACELADVEPRFEEWTEDGMTPIEWVVSMNLHRRHLTTAQRAALALDLLPHLEEEAKDRQRLSQGRSEKGSPISDDLLGRSDEKAAELVGVGRTTVATAKAIRQRDPEIVNQMRAGELNVAQAFRAAGYAPDDGGKGNNAPINDNAPSVFYGKGDKWREAVLPLVRYLAGWEKRGFEFRHVNPAEARRRVKVIDQLLNDLETAKQDLVSRSQIAKLRV